MLGLVAEKEVPRKRSGPYRRTSRQVVTTTQAAKKGARRDEEHIEIGVKVESVAQEETEAREKGEVAKADDSDSCEQGDTQEVDPAKGRQHALRREYALPEGR